MHKTPDAAGVAAAGKGPFIGGVARSCENFAFSEVPKGVSQDATSQLAKWIKAVDECRLTGLRALRSLLYEA